MKVYQLSLCNGFSTLFFQNIFNGLPFWDSLILTVLLGYIVTGLIYYVVCSIFEGGKDNG